MDRVYSVSLAILVCVLTVLSLANGAVHIPSSDILEMTAYAIGMNQDAMFDPGQYGVLVSIRYPRTILAILVGAGLAVSGALMQGLFRNPLADPGLVGVSSGAALGAALVIVLGTQLGWTSSWSIPVAAFVGATLSTLCVLRLSSVGSKTIVANMLLAGIALNSIAGAATGVLVYLADEDQLRDLTFWTLGSLGGASWDDVQLGLLVIGLPTLSALFISKAINVMLLGESAAYSLGVDIQRMKTTIVILVCIIVGCCVSMTGMIGFVGLVVPHLCRLIFGPDNRKVVPASLLVGSALLLGADLVSRLIIIPAELPIGIVTSMIGGPFFLALLSLNAKKGIW